LGWVTFIFVINIGLGLGCLGSGQILCQLRNIIDCVNL